MPLYFLFFNQVVLSFLLFSQKFFKFLFAGVVVPFEISFGLYFLQGLSDGVAELQQHDRVIILVQLTEHGAVSGFFGIVFV